MGARVLPHIADALGNVGDTIARHIPEIDRYADAVGQNIGPAIDAAVPLVKGFASGLQSVASVLVPLIQHGADAASHLRLFGGPSENAHSRLEGVGKVLGIVVAAFIALRAGLATVNVVQTAYNALQAITNALVAANSVGLVVSLIAVLAAGFVLAYNTLKPFHDAVNPALVLLK